MSEYVRGCAAEALGKMGDARAVEPLCAALKDGEHQVRKKVAEALGEMADGRAVEPLCAALTDEAVGVRRAAARSLVSLYKSGNLADSSKRLILSQRKK